jgi:hypothetical protein
MSLNIFSSFLRSIEPRLEIVYFASLDWGNRKFYAEHRLFRSHPYASTVLFRNMVTQSSYSLI